MLSSLYTKKINKPALSKFSVLNQYDNGIPTLERTLTYYDINSKKGRTLLINKYKEFVLQQYIDSLKKSINTKILLKPPLSPIIKVENLLVHYRGNLNSKITFLEISDFECVMCKEYVPLFDSLFIKYKELVRFGYSHFGSYVSVCAIATECAAKQGKFWEMHDSILYSVEIPDTNDIFRIAHNLNLKMDRFKNDFNNREIADKIEDNFYALESAGVYGTPTIMVNNRLIFNSSSIEEIEKTLQYEIKKNR